MKSTSTSKAVTRGPKRLEPASTTPAGVHVQESPAQDFADYLALEELEATLRIREARQDREADQPIEDPPHNVAVRWLSDSARAYPLARTDRDIAATRDCRAKIGNVGEWGSKVGIHKGNLVARRGQHSDSAQQRPSQSAGL